MATEEKDDAQVPGIQDPTDIVNTIQNLRMAAILSNRAPDKEMLALMKHTADTSMGQLRIKSDDDNASAARETVMAMAEYIRTNPSNPFEAKVADEQIAPPIADGVIIEHELDEGNLSIENASPSYDDIVKEED